MKARRSEVKQVDTIAVPITMVMLSEHFERGFEDARRGLPFDWRIGGDETNASWQYERGRALAHIAPLNMPLRIGSKLNPKAVSLCKAAFNRKMIV